MYLQLVLGCIGFSLALVNVWILLLTLCAGLLHVLAIRQEEEHMLWKFGSEYRAYMVRVRRWM